MRFKGDLPAGAGITDREFNNRISSVINALSPAFVIQSGLASFIACISASIASRVLDIRSEYR